MFKLWEEEIWHLCFFKDLIDLQGGTAQVATDALKLRDFSAFCIDLG